MKFALWDCDWDCDWDCVGPSPRSLARLRFGEFSRLPADADGMGDCIFFDFPSCVSDHCVDSNRFESSSCSCSRSCPQGYLAVGDVGDVGGITTCSVLNRRRNARG